MYPILKRAFDIVLALTIGFITLPIIAILIPTLWITQGIVIFRQARPGFQGRLFVLYKFCTMTNANDRHGTLLPDELRLTRIGLILRSLSLDELPQLWNVIKGEMSLVGPRPLLTDYLERYTPEQARRHHVKPGITGWAQINGRNSLDWNDKFTLDLWYVDHRSLSLDLKILALTILQVVRRKGISNRLHATMPEFMGALQSDVSPAPVKTPATEQDFPQH